MFLCRRLIKAFYITLCLFVRFTCSTHYAINCW